MTAQLTRSPPAAPELHLSVRRDPLHQQESPHNPGSLVIAPAVSKMSNTNDAFRGMNGKEALFKSKAELKAEKEAARAAKKLEKSKVSATPSAAKQQSPCTVWLAAKIGVCTLHMCESWYVQQELASRAWTSHLHGCQLVVSSCIAVVARKVPAAAATLAQSNLNTNVVSLFTRCRALAA